MAGTRLVQHPTRPSPLPPCGPARPGPGGVAEWLKAHAWKVCIPETVSRVRIPLPPPFNQSKPLQSLWNLAIQPAATANLPHILYRLELDLAELRLRPPTCSSISRPAAKPIISCSRSAPALFSITSRRSIRALAARSDVHRPCALAAAPCRGDGFDSCGDAVHCERRRGPSGGYPCGSASACVRWRSHDAVRAWCACSTRSPCRCRCGS